MSIEDKIANAKPTTWLTNSPKQINWYHPKRLFYNINYYIKRYGFDLIGLIKFIKGTR